MKSVVRPSIVLVPGAPVLVPELAGSASAECSGGTDAAVAMLHRAGADTRTVEVRGVDPGGRSLGHVGCTLRRWGVDVPVGDGPAVDDTLVPDVAVLGWWFLDRAEVNAPRRFVPVHETASDAVPRADLVVVVADGPASLAPRAPIPEDPRGVALDAELARWISRGGALPDPGPEVSEEIGWWSRPAWRRLAEWLAPRSAGNPTVPPAAEHHSWAPFGVGYHAAVWPGSGTAGVPGAPEVAP